MVLLSNENLSQETSASVMASLVSATKGKSDNVPKPILIDKERMTTLIAILAKLHSPPPGTSDLVVDDRLSTKECVHDLCGIIRRQQTAVTDSALPAYISLSDAINALEKVAIAQKKDSETCIREH